MVCVWEAALQQYEGKLVNAGGTSLAVLQVPCFPFDLRSKSDRISESKMFKELFIF